jgi:hypothetical protein
MAHSLEQKRYFARELARSGGNIAAATKALRDNYESLRTVGESTLRRFLDEIGSGEMIAVEAAWLTKVAIETGAEVERERIRLELMGSEFDRLARDEAILDDLRQIVKSALDECLSSKEKANLPVGQIAALYERMTRVHDARRQRTLPAISTHKDTSLMVRIFAEETLSELGAKAQPFMKRVQDRLERELKAQAASTETN